MLATCAAFRMCHFRAASLAGTAALALCSASALGSGPAAAATVSKLVRVSSGDPFAGCTADNVKRQEQSGNVFWPGSEAETFVAADPGDPDKLVVGFQQDRWTDGGSRGTVARVSRNGGASWKQTIPPGNSACTGGPFDRASDPWVSVAPDGTAYFSSLVINVSNKGQDTTSGITVNRSADGGLTWSKAVTLIKDPDTQLLNDKDSVTADPTKPGYAYTVWDRLAGSCAEDDEGGEGGGASDLRHLAPGATVAAAHDGVAMAQARMRRALAGQVPLAPSAGGTDTCRGPVLFSRTTDGGRTWEKARIIYDPGAGRTTLGNQIVVEPDGTLVDFLTRLDFNKATAEIVLVRSHDKGKTFGAPVVVSGIQLTSFGVATPDPPHYLVRTTLTVFDVAADPKSGNLYAVWEDGRFGGIDTIVLSASTDGGTSWTEPVQVSQTPNSTNKFRRQAFIPSVEVGPGGVVVVTYYDFRNDKPTGELADYWAAFCDPGAAKCSARGGWGGEVRLTDRSFDLLKAPITTNELFIGDYMGLTRAGNDVVAAFAIVDGTNQPSIYSRRITTGGGKAAVASAQ